MHRYHWYRKIRRRKVSGNIIIFYLRLSLFLSMDLPIFIGKISLVFVAKVLDYYEVLTFQGVYAIMRKVRLNLK